MKRTFTTDELYELIDDPEDQISEPWKWGSLETYVFKADDGHFYRISLELHRDEGFQFYGDEHEAERVVPVEKKITEWIRAK